MAAYVNRNIKGLCSHIFTIKTQTKLTQPIGQHIKPHNI